MNRNPNFTKDIMTTPDPYKTDGLYYERPFIQFDGKFGIKSWKKCIRDGKIAYRFDAIWLYEPHTKRKAYTKWL